MLAQHHLGKMDRGAAEENRVAVRRGMRDQLRGDRAAGAGLIVDEHRAEIRLHLVGPRPADNVEHAARRKRQNEPHRMIGITRGSDAAR